MDTPSRLLAESGLGDSGRARLVVGELASRHSWDDRAWAAVFAAAREAPDPELCLLNLLRLSEALPPGDIDRVVAEPGRLRALGALLGGSEFLPEQIARLPAIFAALFLEGEFERRLGPGPLAAEALAAADAAPTEDAVKSALRRIKLREMARIAARDLSGLSTLEETMRDISQLAEAALSAAVAFGRRALDARFGPARVPAPGGGTRPCGFVVMGMGKLGAHELNFSSDVDLIYLYETDRGTTAGGAEKGPVTFHEYFVRLSETVTRIVSEATPDGFVFRVDLRLRPEGSRGDIANSLRSAEIYYESWGQTWERAAMIKARAVAGDVALGDEFLRVIAPFVYRKYLDFTSITEIREMKDKIDAALARGRRGGRDLKLGAGGIREIEFFAQAHQLIYGGKEPSLRVRGTVAALDALARLGIVSERERTELAGAYAFLRALEHRIQVFRERQTHSLPVRDSDRLRLARAMRLPTAAALLAEIDRRAGAVREIYARLFGGAKPRAEAPVPAEVAALLEADTDDRDIDDKLRAAGFRDLDAARRNLAALKDGPPRVRLPARARRYLEKIAPAILARVVGTPDPDLALSQMERFLAAVGGRTMVYALLFENRKVIDALVPLFGSSPFLSGYLLRHPELLDTFLRRDLSPPVKSKSALRGELGEALAASADLEQELDELRRFKNLETLRIGMHDLAGGISLEEGMFQLSALAEVLLSFGLQLARREVSRRFGVPVAGDGPDAGKPASFCIVGMGKLGAEELSYHSDLDIIFLFSAAGETVPGPDADPAAFRSLSNHEYFWKLAQRLISVLTTVTREGHVYRLDTRLRPSGNAGPLVTSLDSFEKYHRESAQLWERQALLKGRFVAGDREFGKKVEAAIAERTFDRPLPPGAAAEIHRLRMRMETELGRESPGRLNLKVGRGGIVDVEFAVQYLQLLHGPSDPNRSIRARSTLKALYELSRAGLLGKEEFQALDEGYRFLRTFEVRQRLSHDASIEQFDPSVLSPGMLERYLKETERIRQVYLGILGL